MTATIAAPQPATNPWLIAPVVATAAFMEVLDISIANVALQHIAGDLSVSPDQSTWILTSYLVTNAIVLPVSGWLSTVLGRKRFFMSCIAGFSVSSLLCGLAPTLPLLILFRTIQGLTGGGLQPSAQAIIADAFPPSKRGMAFALYGMSVVFAPAIGPTLGGWITDTASWRWVFLINVPVGALLLPMIQAMVTDPPHAVAERIERWKKGIRIDYVGFALLVVGIGCLQVMLDKGQRDDWFSSPMITALAALSVTGLVAFVLWELGQEDPIVDLRLLANRNFGTANILMFMLGVVLLSSTVLLPLLVQSLYGYTATEAGLVITPGGFAIMMAMPIVGRLITVLDARKMIACGLVVCSYSLYRMGHLTLGADYYTLMTDRIIQTLGLSLLFIPISTVAYIGLPRAANNQASAIINLSRNLGGSIGISLTVTMLSRFTQAHQTALVDRVSPSHASYRDLLSSLTDAFLRHGASMAEAVQRAEAKIAQMVQAHASMLGFLDDFMTLAVSFVVMIPVVFVMRRPSHADGPPGGGH
jgi:DHA2 family multidrug resistance protein